MKPMDIRFNRTFAIALSAVGALLLVISVINVQPISIAAGAILTLLGILMLVNPMMRIGAREVQVRNPLGMTLKRYTLSSPADLRLEGNTLHHVPDNKKIGSLGFSADRGSVEALRAQLSNSGR